MLLICHILIGFGHSLVVPIGFAFRGIFSFSVSGVAADASQQLIFNYH